MLFLEARIKPADGSVAFSSYPAACHSAMPDLYDVRFGLMNLVVSFIDTWS